MRPASRSEGYRQKSSRNVGRLPWECRNLRYQEFRSREAPLIPPIPSTTILEKQSCQDANMSQSNRRDFLHQPPRGPVQVLVSGSKAKIGEMIGRHAAVVSLQNLLLKLCQLCYCKSFQARLFKVLSPILPSF